METGTSKPIRRLASAHSMSGPCKCLGGKLGEEFQEESANIFRQMSRDIA